MALAVEIEVEPQRCDLLNAAQAFCHSFAQTSPLDDILAHFAENNETNNNNSSVICIEHGLARLAPFLGRQFKGIEGAKDYFNIISDLLSYENMNFSNYIVDTQSKKVSVTGNATFTWISTGNSWQETFTYALAFDDNYKLIVYEVWADSGAAYLASRGELT